MQSNNSHVPYVVRGYYPAGYSEVPKYGAVNEAAGPESLELCYQRVKTSGRGDNRYPWINSSFQISSIYNSTPFASDNIDLQSAVYLCEYITKHVYNTSVSIMPDPENFATLIPNHNSPPLYRHIIGRPSKCVRSGIGPTSRGCIGKHQWLIRVIAYKAEAEKLKV